jgi:hypothetical protein
MRSLILAWVLVTAGVAWIEALREPPAVRATQAELQGPWAKPLRDPPATPQDAPRHGQAAENDAGLACEETTEFPGSPEAPAAGVAVYAFTACEAWRPGLL